MLIGRKEDAWKKRIPWNVWDVWKKAILYIILNLREGVINVGFERELEIEDYDKNVWLCDWENCATNKKIEKLSIISILSNSLNSSLNLYPDSDTVLLIFLKPFPPSAYILSYIYFSVKWWFLF